MSRRTASHRRLATASLLVGLAVATIAGCSGDDDSNGDPPSSDSASESESTGATDGPDRPSDSEPAVTEPETTMPAVVPPVAAEGSVEDVLAQTESVSNFAAAVTEWMELVPGQEGVLRNARGVTVFAPDDAGFTEADREAALVDLDAFAVFLGEHLYIGTLTSDNLGDTVTTAMGTPFPVGDGPTIGGRLIVEPDVAATNGMIQVIDGPLVPVPTAG